MPTTLTFLSTSAAVPGPGDDTVSIIFNGRVLVDCGWYAALNMQRLRMHFGRRMDKY